ncbi:MAG: hypothetical protein K2M12_08965 [Muribaculaceae bacterium]|nr:hypothetical protein [Muribaculaceae bacterium]
MFKKTSILGVAAASMLTLICSCGGNKDGEILEKQATRINNELTADAASNPGVFAEARATYGDSALNVNIVFADSIFNVADYSQELVEFFLADEIKSAAGEDLDETVNTLAKTKEPLRLTLTDVYGTTRSYDLPAVTLRTLFKTQRSQLHLPEVRTQVMSILADRSFQFAVGEGVQKADCELKSSFVTYTIVYDNAKAYSRLNVANLKARYLKLLKPIYKAYGPLANPIVEMDRSLGIDGYRFILTTPSGDSELKCTLPWREILAD